MSYASVVEADDRLSYSAAWLALSEEEKQNHLVTAVLWLNSSYVFKGCVSVTEIEDVQQAGFPYSFPVTLSRLAIAEVIKPVWPRVECCTGAVLKDDNGFELTGIPYEIRSAQILAAEANLSTPLFSEPTTETGGLSKKRIRAGSVEIEKVWQLPQRGKLGELLIPTIDSMLQFLGHRKGVHSGRLVNFV